MSSSTRRAAPTAPPAALTVAAGITLPLDLITESNAVLGKKGSGKTSALIVLLEEMYAAGVPVVSIDPKGDHYGIRSSADGTGDGLPIPVLGGLYGDIPLEPTAGALIADLIIDRRLSCVLDVSEFSRADVIRFLTAFADRLYRHANRSPMHLFLEECHEYLPQQVRGEEAKLVGAFQRIVKMGRFKGIGVTLASQRSAAVNKDVLEQVDNLFVMRTTGPRDREAIARWVDTHADAKAIVDSLPSLYVGECWLWQPSRDEPINFRFRMRRTFDAGRTPKVGESQLPQATLAPVDLGEIRDAIAATIERAEADDPAHLRAEIGRLRRELAKKPAAAAPVVREVEVPVVGDPEVAALRQLAADLTAAVAGLSAALDRVNARPAPAGPSRPAPHVTTSAKQPSAATLPPARPVAPARTPAPDGAPVLGRAERKILAVLATNGTLTNQQVSLLSGYSVKSSGFNNALGKLRSGGLTVGGKDANTITEVGLTVLGDHDPLPTGPALVAHWMQNLGKAERAILDALIRAWPNTLTNDDISEITGYSTSSSGFNNALGRLRTLQLISGSRHANIAADTLGEARDG